MASTSILGMAVALSLVSIIIIGMSGFIGGMSSTYDLDIDDNSGLNMTDDMQEFSEELSTTMNNTQVNNPLSVGNFFISSVVNSVMLMFNIAGDMTNFIIGSNGQGGLAGMLGVPGWLPPIIIGIVSLLLVFGIMKALTGRSNI